MKQNDAATARLALRALLEVKPTSAPGRANDGGPDGKNGGPFGFGLAAKGFEDATSAAKSPQFDFPGHAYLARALRAEDKSVTGRQE